MPKKDVNEFIADDFMRHSIDLDRLSEGERAKALRSLKKLETELTDKLKSTKKLTSFQVARTQALLQQTRGTISKTYKRLNTTQRESLKTIYEVEKNFVTQTLNNRIGASVASVFIDAKATKAAVDGTLIEGAPSGRWWSTQSTRLKNKFENTIRTGVLAGETNDQMIRRVRGTKALGFKDGLMQIPRHEASALVRTSTQAVANKARKDTYEENQDIIKAVQQISTLDTKTTLICMSYGGLTWSMQTAPDGSTVYTPIGHGKNFTNITPDGVRHEGPPRHFSCRSALSPVTKSWEELANVKVEQKGKKDEIFREKFERRLKERGFSEDRIKRIEANTRASMKGQVPKDIGQEGWLKTQKKSVQIDALGPERWALWKEGRIKDFQQLTDNSGRPLLVKDYIKRVKPKKLTPVAPKKPVSVTPKPVELDILKEPENFRNPLKKATSEYDDEMKRIINRTPGVREVVYDASDEGAFYFPGQVKIQLRTEGWSSTHQTVLHEYSHHVDNTAGREALSGTSRRNMTHVSSLANEIMEEEAELLIRLSKKERTFIKIAELDDEIDRLIKAKKIPFTKEELREMAPILGDRADLVSALVRKDAKAFNVSFSPKFDNIVEGQGELKSATADYFGSLSKNTLARGHDLDYYIERVVLDFDDVKVKTGQLSEMWAQYWSLKTRSQGQGKIFEKIFRFFTPKTVDKFEALMENYMKAK